jgi:hypothetical protein
MHQSMCVVCSNLGGSSGLVHCKPCAVTLATHMTGGKLRIPGGLQVLRVAGGTVYVGLGVFLWLLCFAEQLVL